MPKVLVSGCFDMLHSGHIAFLQEAATYGDLYVALGSDRTVFELKRRITVNSDEERLYMIKALAAVEDAFVSRGSGTLDFQDEARELKPDYFVVNKDGHTEEKQRFIESIGAEYVVLDRTPHADLTPRSTTSLRQITQIPYRIDLCGGWLDQPFVSREHPGSVVTVSLEPTIEFNERSGMATSTRRKAIELWGPRLPVDGYEKLTKILFCYDNPPGTREFSGSQDAIGIVYPGLARAYYDGDYWPEKIEHVLDEEALTFVQESLYLVPIEPRSDDYEVLSETRITRESAKALATAADDCWEAIQHRDLAAFGRAIREGFEAQVAMFPHMKTPAVEDAIERHTDGTLGWKLSGAGGGGYLILVADEGIPDATRVAVRGAEY